MTYFIGAIACYPRDELIHYGVKGMKWGVRRTPEQLGHRKAYKRPKNDHTVRDAIESGKVSKTVNVQKQSRHVKESKLYEAGRSYLLGDLDFANKLVSELSGTGVPVMKGKEWLNKERVSSTRFIGVHVDNETGEETRTRDGMIVYSKTGTHIYPIRRPK